MIYLDPKNNNLEIVSQILERTSLIISGYPHIDQISDNYWSVDGNGNNWWMKWEESAGTIELKARVPNPEIINHIHCVLIHFFMLENFNKKSSAA